MWHTVAVHLIATINQNDWQGRTPVDTQHPNIKLFPCEVEAACILVAALTLSYLRTCLFLQTDVFGVVRKGYGDCLVVASIQQQWVMRVDSHRIQPMKKLAAA